MSMKCSAIICTRNRKSELERCLESISRQTLFPDEVVIVDGSDTDSLPALLNEQRFKQLILIYKHTDPGLTRQRNIGAGLVKGDVILYLDDDVVLENNYISEIMMIFREKNNENIGGVTGNIVNMKQTDSKIVKIIKKIFFLSDFGNGNFKLSGCPTYPSGKNYVRQTEFLSGCNMAYRASVLSEFCFDENMKGYCYWEDADFSYRVSRKYNNYYTPYAELWHFPNKPKDCNQNEIRSYYNVITQYYLFKKNIPKTLKNIICFTISIIGELILSIYLESWDAVKGYIQGIRAILFNKKKSIYILKRSKRISNY